MYKKTLELQPEDIRIKDTIARFYLKHNKLEDSEKYVAEILKERPKYFPARMLKGELLVLRIMTGDWHISKGLLDRALVWGFLGMVIVLMFNVFSVGVAGALASGFLPGGNWKLALAFFTSATMNLSFGPTLMAFHRITDTFIDLRYENKKEKATLNKVVKRIDWDGFVSFVLVKTIPIFWIPAHTITFLLPSEYRVLMAAFLSIALGAILAFAKKKQTIS